MTEFLVGMDVGQKQDHTAIAVVQRVQRGTGYELRHVERVNLNTPVQQVVERAEHLLRTPQLWGRSTLALDATGAGLPVVDRMRQANTMCTAAGIGDAVMGWTNKGRWYRSGGAGVAGKPSN